MDGDLAIACAASGYIRHNDWPVFIRENSHETNREWNGRNGDVRIYSHALTRDQIKAVFAE